MDLLQDKKIFSKYVDDESTEVSQNTQTKCIVSWIESE